MLLLKRLKRVRPERKASLRRLALIVVAVMTRPPSASMRPRRLAKGVPEAYVVVEEGGIGRWTRRTSFAYSEGSEANAVAGVARRRM